MYLGHMDDSDQTIARVLRVVTIVLVLLLTITGVLQLFFHQGDPAWSGYQLGSGQFRQPTNSTGLAEAHAALSDLSGIVVLFFVAWFSGRVLHRVSRFAVAVAVLLVTTIITGSIIRFNLIIVDDEVISDTSGYLQFFSGSADGAVTDSYELGRWTMAIWTVLHVVSIPVLVGGSLLTMRRATARRARYGWRRGST